MRAALAVIVIFLLAAAASAMPNDGMSVSPAGRGYVKAKEGWRSTTYRCAAGRRTIGWGFTGSWVRDGMTITKEQARKHWIAYEKRFTDPIKRRVTRKLEQREFDAVFSGLWNFGAGYLRGKILDAINRADTERFAFEWYKIRHCKGRELRGLANRRAEEIAMFKGEMNYEYYLRFD